jgi:60 kDa SS-A/Ro ribonucleoprotein
LQQLRRSVMSCLLWENEFYEDGKKIADRICQLVSECRAEDVVKVAIEAKQEMRLRHVPLLLARELARTEEGRKQMKQLLPHLISRPDDITELLAIYLLGQKPRSPAKLPNQMKKYLGKAFEKFDEYQLAKWNGGKKAVSLKDAMKLTHPVAQSPEQLALWGRLIKGELKTPDTWEVELSASADKLSSWQRLLKENRLGGLAMLRNIRNMDKAGVGAEQIKAGIEGINAGRLLPINFISAAKYNPQYEPILEKKFLECFADKKKLDGKTIILVDVSGSMDYPLSGKSELKRIDVACSLAMIGAELFSDLRIMTFSTKLVEVPVRRGFGLRDAILNSQQHGGTDLGGAVRAMPKDIRLIVITDEQSQTPVEQRKGYMINVASNEHGVGYHQWTHVDGWSDKVLQFVIEKEQDKNH